MSLQQVPTFNSILTNYNELIVGASIAETMQAATWYSEAQSIARELSVRYNESLEATACVLAAFSPRTRWAQNVLNAQLFLQGESVGALGNNIRMAEAGLREGFSALKGRKTNAFARNIAGDMSRVTIDVWMIRAAGYDRLDANKGMYDLMSGALTALAYEYKVTPAQLQALCWIRIRGTNA